MSDQHKRDIAISRALSKLLRHAAAREGLDIDSNGYVPLTQVITHRFIKSHHGTVEDIQRIVDNNNKRRFSIKNFDGKLYICALQGHSIEAVSTSNDELQLIGIDVEWPQYIVHGTFRDKLPLILNSKGLSKMNRNHIHFSYTIPSKFSKFLPGEAQTATSNDIAISGVRTQCQVLIMYDIEKLKKSDSNLKFYKSKNDVILSSGNSNGVVPNDCIWKIIDMDTGVVDFTSDKNS